MHTQVPAWDSKDTGPALLSWLSKSSYWQFSHYTYVCIHIDGWGGHDETTGGTFVCMSADCVCAVLFSQVYRYTDILSCLCICLLGIQEQLLAGCCSMRLQQPYLYQATKFTNPLTSCNNSCTVIANIRGFDITDYNTMQGETEGKKMV